MPTLVDDADWGGWLWYQAIGPMVGLSVTESENNGVLAKVRIEIDSKAMRKLKPNETVFGAFEFTTEVGAATVRFAMDSRMLVKLP